MAGAYPRLYATPAATSHRFTGGGGVAEPAAEEQLTEEQVGEDTALAELAAELEAEDAEEEATAAAAEAAAAWMDVGEAAAVVELAEPRAAAAAPPPPVQLAEVVDAGAGALSLFLKLRCDCLRSHPLHRVALTRLTRRAFCRLWRRWSGLTAAQVQRLAQLIDGAAGRAVAAPAAVDGEDAAIQPQRPRGVITMSGLVYTPPLLGQGVANLAGDAIYPYFAATSRRGVGRSWSVLYCVEHRPPPPSLNLPASAHYPFAECDLPLLACRSPGVMPQPTGVMPHPALFSALTKGLADGSNACVSEQGGGLKLMRGTLSAGDDIQGG